MPQYDVTVTVTFTQTMTFQVDAEDSESAEVELREQTNRREEEFFNRLNRQELCLDDMRIDGVKRLPDPPTTSETIDDML